MARSVVSPAAPIGHQHLDQGIIAETFEHVSSIKLGLAIGHLAVIGFLGPDEGRHVKDRACELALVQRRR